AREVGLEGDRGSAQRRAGPHVAGRKGVAAFEHPGGPGLPAPWTARPSAPGAEAPTVGHADPPRLPPLYATGWPRKCRAAGSARECAETLDLWATIAEAS